jgi:hypothetical protein
MSVATAAPEPDPVDEPGARWRPTANGLLDCGRWHAGPGSLDESLRRLSHPEFDVAQRLADEGHHVVAVPEIPGQGRAADLRACGTGVEVKSWLPLGQGRHQPPQAHSVVNKVLAADGQADVVVLNGRGSGLTALTARAGMAEYGSQPRSSPIRAVRVVGDGFDLSWTRDQTVQRARPLRPNTPRRTARKEAPDLGPTL